MNQEAYNDAVTNAETAFLNENYETSLEWLDKALAEKPDDLYAMRRAAAVCLPLGRFDDAIARYQRLTELEPDNGDNFFYLGNAYFFAGDYGSTLAQYAQAEMKGCSETIQPRLYYQTAMLCSVRKDVKAALINFKKYEDADKSRLAALDPDIIAEKIKLYMLAEDYKNAAQCARQWISVSPSDLKCYMVHFSILMAAGRFEDAEHALDDAAKYAELDAAGQVTLELERVSMYITRGDAQPASAKDDYEKALLLLNTLMQKATPDRKDDVSLALAELKMKLGAYDEAIRIASALLPDAEKAAFAAAPAAAKTGGKLSEYETDAMIEADMEAIDNAISSGVLQDDLGGDSDVSYDENGNAVREYDSNAFSVLGGTGKAAADTSAAVRTAAAEHGSEFYDKVYFVLLSCYAASEDYENTAKLAGLLKFSTDTYYAYFARYSECFAAKKLAAAAKPGYSAAEADRKYAEGIAYFRGRMSQTQSKNYAAVFRARMYAETGKFAKAEEMAGLLPENDKQAVLQYIADCKKELTVA